MKKQEEVFNAMQQLKNKRLNLPPSVANLDYDNKLCIQIWTLEWVLGIKFTDLEDVFKEQSKSVSKLRSH